MLPLQGNTFSYMVASVVVGMILLLCIVHVHASVRETIEYNIVAVVITFQNVSRLYLD